MNEKLHLIGYWIESLRDDRHVPPQELVRDWEPETQEKVAAYLKQGIGYLDYRGYSWCRFGCQGVPMGASELTDGVWAWPEGLEHYVRHHSVGLPDDFVAHVLGGGSRPGPMRVLPERNEDLWLMWCRDHASGALRDRIEAARRAADAAAEALREKAYAQVEARFGVSENPCSFTGCTRKALQGKVVCARCSGGIAHDPGAIAYFAGLTEALNPGMTRPD